jgi:tetratricopeptide (TPR) repeat protein
MSVSKFFGRLSWRVRTWCRVRARGLALPGTRSLGRLFWQLRVGLYHLIVPVLRVVPRLFWLIGRWWHGRSFRLLLQGLPALLFGIAALAVITLSLLTPAQELQACYQDHAENAFKTRDYKEALACYERLAILRGDEPEVLYKLAETAEEAGQRERAVVMMSQLAPVDKQGYARAHFWQAHNALLAGKGSIQAQQLAVTHFQRALEGGFDDANAVHARLGDLYAQKGQLEPAELHYIKAAQTKPYVRLRLMRVFALRGNKERARAEAQIAANLFSTWAGADLYNHAARLHWAEAVTFLEDFPRALTILNEGWTGTGDAVYPRALGQAYAFWFDFVSRSPSPDPALRLALLERGLQNDPKNVGLLNRLLQITNLGEGRLISPVTSAGTLALAGSPAGPGAWLAASARLAQRTGDAEHARQVLRRLLAQGQATAQAHFALGVDAWAHGRVKEARLHWERANQLAPHSPVIANNLAWLLYQLDPPDLPRALLLMNLAIETAPNDMNYRDTRGHIFLKMGKWKEALADLEAALPTTPNGPEMHRSLAEVYEHLDAPAMAAEHRRLAQEQAAAVK